MNRSSTPIVVTGVQPTQGNSFTNPRGGVHGSAPVPVSSSSEQEDIFEISNSIPNSGFQLLDRASMNMIANSRAGPRSVATTELASAVGSVVRDPNDAFLKSITFPKGSEWGIQFFDQAPTRGWGKRKRKTLVIESVGGVLTLSRIQEGDSLKMINGKKVGPSMNAELALARMNQCLEKDGYLSIATSNKELGDDILIQATVIKPRPNMKYEEMGMEVWFWGFLCIKSISKESVFANTVLRDTDHIVNINDIECDRLKPRQFAEILNGLEHDVTITVLRRKQRWAGKYG